MKNSLYLLIPKGISELLEIDETRECSLSTDKEDGRPILKYAFSAKGTRADRERAIGSREASVPRVPVHSHQQ